MILYYELSGMERGMYGICTIILMMAAIAILVTVCTRHMELRYALSAFVLATALLFVLQGLTDVNYQMISGGSFCYFAKVIGRLPWAFVALLLLLCAIIESIFVWVLWREKKNRLTPGAIKEGMDALPDGICFFSADGQPLLVNIQMNRISGELFDTEILNAEDFWKQLKTGERMGNGVILRTEPTVLVRTEDGKIWDFHRNILAIGHSEIQELIAYDVTRQYELYGELEKQNQRLSRINERLRLYSREVEQITAENEILTAKIKVHDNVGRSLLAFRSYLTQSPAERDQEQLLLLWRYTIEVLKNEADNVNQQDRWGLLLKAAQAVDVTIVREGELPESEKEKNILIAALHECLTNTVKHANGNELYVSIRSGDTSIMAKMTNNGAPPHGRIEETGGLKNLRRTIETAGGIMTIESSPRFVLQVELPKGE
ncbi:MAG: hypothetical protein PUC12_00385 [Clostridiales bacterium]|nr:hypothetical protein [Clostridiales bacterium]